MANGIYADIFKELKARLEANLTGETVEIGVRDITTTQDMEKRIFIYPTNITEVYGKVQQDRGKTGTISVTLACSKAIITDSPNNVYNASDESNCLIVWVEQVLDALNTTTGGVVNPQLENTANAMGITVTNFQYGSSVIWFDIVLEIDTKTFTINKRRY